MTMFTGAATRLSTAVSWRAVASSRLQSPLYFTTDLSRCFSSSDAGGVYEGTVKNYSSRKGYGFIKVNGTTEEVFVHRNAIVCDYPIDELPIDWPYLKGGERVAFVISDPEDEGRESRVAKQVTFANRNPIPAIRKFQLAATRTRNNVFLGRTIRKILSDHTKTTEEMNADVHRVFNSVLRNEENEKEKIATMGLNPDDYDIKPMNEKTENSSSETETALTDS